MIILHYSNSAINPAKEFKQASTNKNTIKCRKNEKHVSSMNAEP